MDLVEILDLYRVGFVSSFRLFVFVLVWNKG